MTKEQIEFANALAGCTFVSGTGTKRFSRDMASRAQLPEPPALTDKQAEYLRTAVIRFRRQISSDVVELAIGLAP